MPKYAKLAKNGTWMIPKLTNATATKPAGKRMSWTTFAPGIPQPAWDIVRRVANCSTAEARQEIRAPMRRQGSSLVTADEPWITRMLQGVRIGERP
jgi:hypothetical protein